MEADWLWLVGALALVIVWGRVFDFKGHVEWSMGERE